MSSLTPIRHRVGSLLIPFALVATAAACSGGDRTADGDSSSAPGASTTASGMGADSGAHAGMAGMDHGAMSRAAARDSNQSFLRMMSDHHHGLIVMADSAGPKLDATAKADAQKLATKQRGGQQRMLAMLGTQYGDSIMPMMMPSNRMMMDSTMRAPAAESGRVFYRQVIAHHREGIEMIDRYMPQLTGEVKQMATTMRTEQTKEIGELEKKAGSRG